MTKLFVPLDIETDGLDPDENHILEIAWQVIDEKFEPLSPLRTYVLDQDLDWLDVFHAIRNNPFIAKMHGESGLAADLAVGGHTKPWKIRDQLQADVSNALSPLSTEEYLESTVHLMGLSVGFDRSFLVQHEDFKDWFPKPGREDVRGKFHHRLFDLSSVKILLDTIGVPWEKAPSGSHRAGADVQEVIEQARIFRDTLAPLSIPFEVTE